ncbi:MAG TPA: tetraacyldisaccharide 4'-kinase, partial [Pedobacter sp.]|nr:tetraacyldisaccharide 4'-kinase [Pedobacter sp.]
VILIRNVLYDTGVFKSVSFEIPVICVGNLVVGGSGKTPFTEYLIGLLGNRKIAVLSRGYGRKTTGFILADQNANAETIGDEPMQFYTKFPQVTVAVCESRVKGIKMLQASHDLIILDDAFQHRAVKPGFSILLFEYQKLLRPQFLLPAGNLREPFRAYKRADLLLLTKAPQFLDNKQMQTCINKFKELTNAEPIISFLEYGKLTSLNQRHRQPAPQLSAITHIFLLTGIANPKPLLSHLEQYSLNIHHHEYADHYNFRTRDVEKLVNAFQEHPSKDKLIITTEKDVQRLNNAALKELLLNLPVFYLPVKIALGDKDKAIFDQKILDYVSGTTRNR